MIFIVWDEFQLYGYRKSSRCWPRLILEAAEYGDITSFSRQSEGAWPCKTQVSLLCDVSSGLQTLHNVQVAHCDVKMGKGFYDAREAQSWCLFSGEDMRPKISIIISDYLEGKSIFKRIGTEPWNALELSIRKTTKVRNLPMSDINALAFWLPDFLCMAKVRFNSFPRNTFIVWKARIIIPLNTDSEWSCRQSNQHALNIPTPKYLSSQTSSLGYSMDPGQKVSRRTA